MKLRVRDVYNLIDEFSPFYLTDSFDNTGILFGSADNEVTSILFTLDISIESVQEAINNKCDLIISHHPFIFQPLKLIDTDSYKGRVIRHLFENDISVISAHTNMDIAKKGVSYCLAEMLNLRIEKPITIENQELGVGYGYIGSIEPVNLSVFLKTIKDNLGCPRLNVINGFDNKKIEKVAVCGGSGCDFIEKAFNDGIDLYLTGDVKYHDAQLATELGIVLVDGGHFYTEYKGFKYLIEHLRNKANDLKYIQFYKPFSNSIGLE